jgi:putative cell wall-binding protein
MRRKWISGALAVTVASSLFAFPALTHAAGSGKTNLEEELLKARRLQVMRQLETYSAQQKTSMKKAGTRTHTMSASSATVQDATSVTYSSKISKYQFHTYAFTVKTGGTVQIQASTSTSPDVDYMLMGSDGTVYQNGDSLPAGQYMFTVTSISDTPVDYSYTISGVTFDGTPDKTLPNVNVTSPASHKTRVAKGTKTVTFSGTHDANATAYLVDNNSMQPTQLDQSFNQNVNVSLGLNEIGIVATEPSGNMLFDGYEIMVPGVKRLAGANRYEVAANISKEKNPFGAETVVISRGDLFTDALSGGSLASEENAPILLSDYKSQTLPTPIENEIKRLGATKAIILGGTGSVSTKVESQLKTLGVNNIERIAGKNRFEVSAKIADKVFSKYSNLPADMQPDTVIIASGLVFPDALSASSPSGQLAMPILQVTKDTIPAEIDSFIKTHTNVKNFIIVGGPGTVSTAVESQLKSIASGRGGKVDRIGGANRFEVSVNTAKYFAQNWMMDQSIQVYASGLNFPDALAGGPLAAYIGAPMMLTPTSSLAQTTVDYLNSLPQKDMFYILGGTGSVSTKVESQLDSQIQ